jgi:hypothetical protein
MGVFRVYHFKASCGKRQKGRWPTWQLQPFLCAERRRASGREAQQAHPGGLRILLAAVEVGRIPELAEALCIARTAVSTTSTISTKGLVPTARPIW